MTHHFKKNISEREVIAEFAKRRSKLTRLAIFLGIIVGGVVIMDFQTGISKPTTAILLGISFIWALIVHVKIWRCPSCNGHLGRLYLGLKEPKFCPNCGIKLINSELGSK